MKNIYIENLKNSESRADHILADFIEKHLQDLNLVICANRGDMFESALTQEPTKRSGLHVVSTGDWVFNGEVVEIKYITKKTKASNQRLGTIANYYLIGFNDGLSIDLRLIKKCDLIVNKDNKISYQDNHDLGIKVNL